ncbi:MAG: phosphoribosylanthranilate isomerase [Bacteroidia bacterium]|nr:phosphoribosylanthranilate isomerase [Bacteroidia bacterium]MBT8268649.1 phosphoribosylanthranilate isomerase [Bacteroidia bacterium]NNF81464.1 phosphoribosylanthranilate isomerase [Flavobacteriaceae bacterium]NNK71531.1 phosphoribosylanthranilate isomerase [Flavobacteriaceae bacterium]NNL79110.1 phosphoribosylanthranilate isomerase [Flavobacteriaceae bacterium]
MKIKVCGMKYADNIIEAGILKPDYMGFIFYPESKRFVTKSIPKLPDSVDKVGVFVNEKIEKIIDKVRNYDLQAIQLHGKESVEYCRKIRSEFEKLSPQNPVIIKAFPIGADFDFDDLLSYEGLCDFFLFDAKGELPGGNGVLFDWRLLETYSLQTPFFLSGGIGPESIEDLHHFMKTKVAKKCYAIDVNSGFEDGPGLKNINKLSDFIKKL